ncbi:MAG: 30S ribosomal protein S18 [Actinobacteria bacterium]|nr:30S ribosomal protein S18 [Actinomycetota bacterium]
MPSKARSSKRRDEKPGRRREDRPGRRFKKKVCYFCAESIEHIDYKDVALLRKFMSDRAKIRSSRVTGNCVQHQRRVARAIKNARELALLPYTNR